MIYSRKSSIKDIFIFVVCVGLANSANGCIEFQNTLCSRCDPASYHLYNGRCYANLIGCLRYQNGSQCVECDTSFSTLVNGTCDYSSAQTTFAQQKISQVYLYDGRSGQQYGESNFRPITVEQARSMITFRVLDSFLRTGQYRHRISRTQQPVFSVYTYRRDDRQSYRILYDGTGGAVILTIADVNINTLVPTIRSIVVISIHQRIDYCSLYTQRQACQRCIDGYHLQNGRCYLNIGGCVSYKKNICLRCLDYFFLVENRCTSDCRAVSDARTVFYYGMNRQRSTFESVYGNAFNQSSNRIVLNATQQITISTNTVLNQDPNCADVDENGKCRRCYPSFYVNDDNICSAVNPLCETYSEEDGGCLSCYLGYKLIDKQCIIG